MILINLKSTCGRVENQIEIKLNDIVVKGEEDRTRAMVWALWVWECLQATHGVGQSLFSHDDSRPN